MQIAPPASRRVEAREILDVPCATGQAGYPASMNADACFGYSAAGYPSSKLAIASCYAGGSIIIRRMGQALKDNIGAT